MSIHRIKHIAIAIGLLERMSDNSLRDCFTQGSGKRRPSAKRCRAELKAWRDRGLKWVPNSDCDNQATDGACLGHEKETKGVSIVST